MQSITICEGVTLIATKSTIDAYMRELRELELERELREWLNSHDITDELYSDVFKDMYGVRPR